MPTFTESAVFLKWYSASLYVCVFLIIAGFVSPRFNIVQLDRDTPFESTRYFNVWYAVECHDKKCKTSWNNYRLHEREGKDGRVSIKVMWPIFATMSVVTAIGAAVIDVIVCKATTCLAVQRVLELIEFVILLLTGNLSLVVAIFYGYYVGLFKQNLDPIRFQPSTVALPV